jgi:hypothetical protein
MEAHGHEAVPELGRARGPISLGMLGFVLLAVALVGWWGQDMLGTVVNEGEVDTGQRLSFTAEPGTYRVVTSGPAKPQLESTACDIVHPNEKRERILGGAGDVNPVETLGTARVAQFEGMAGRTTVTCMDRLSPQYTGGRFQVVASSGPVRYGLGAAAALGVLFVVSGILWGLVRARRA